MKAHLPKSIALVALVVATVIGRLAAAPAILDGQRGPDYAFQP